ncbi:MAG TPA: SDR family oxidoreductase [Cytophagales bacterium]|nr:SDR family oxidoreductase [Cytophagales bacterium]
MKATENNYALITGATTGIGYELAKLFAKDGFNVILVARTAEDLESVANEFRVTYGVTVIPIAKDLFNPEAAFELYDDIKARGITVNILVNDAGQGVYGEFVDTDIRRQLKVIQLNISSLTALTYLYLKDMVARNEGRILQVASIVSESPAPLQSVYGGTKAYVLSFTEALINEVKDTDVVITSLQPGVTDTDFFNKAGAQNTNMAQNKANMSNPADVAKDGYEALMAGKRNVVSGFKNKMQSVMSHLLPDQVSAEQTRKQTE